MKIKALDRKGRRKFSRAEACSGLFALQRSDRSQMLSTPFHKYDHVCCVAFRFWRGATREHPPSRPVGMTEEQQRQNRKATQPCGRRFFSAQTSLLAPYPDVSGKGMRVVRASSGPKIPRRKRGRIYEMGYLVGALNTYQFPANCQRLVQADSTVEPALASPDSSYLRSVSRPRWNR